MPAKVFISCGQAVQGERDCAKRLSEWFESKGYRAYVAIESQSINDINNSIIWNLRTSDYYIFIDFKREKLSWDEVAVPSESKRYRGSLFTHQELAMSYLLGFPEVIFIQQEGLHLEGLLQYILGNPRRFKDYEDAYSQAIDEVARRHWSPNFTRALDIEWIPLVGPFIYGDRTTGQQGRNCRVGKLKVKNMRMDIPARKTIARFEKLVDNNGNQSCPDNSSLKWAGAQEYDKMIFENEEASFDAFSILESDPYKVFLHSATDFIPRQPIIQGPAGKYLLCYSISAEGFPKTGVKLELKLTGNITTTEVRLVSVGYYDSLDCPHSNSPNISSKSMNMIAGETPRSGSL